MTGPSLEPAAEPGSTGDGHERGLADGAPRPLTGPSDPSDPSAQGARSAGAGRRPGSPLWVHVLLFVATLLSTFFVGAVYKLKPLELDPAAGFAFSATLMTILVAHEAGHYLAARYHGVEGSLPYFIPVPLPGLSITGTLGAVISMRTDQATRSQLLDIGAAGPICGFIVAVPAMILGVRLSVPIPQAGGAIHLGDSLLSLGIERLFAPPIPPGFELQAHPIWLAAWAGFLVTALNLLPMGQLDGGHVLFAWDPSAAEGRMRRVFRAVIALTVVGFAVQLPAIADRLAELLGYAPVVPAAIRAGARALYPWFSSSFLLLALLARAIGLRHPPAREEHVPLTPGRRATALLCLVIFTVTFMPNPIWADDDDPRPPSAAEEVHP